MHWLLRALDRQGQREWTAAKLEAQSRMRAAMIRGVAALFFCLALVFGIVAGTVYLSSLWGAPAALGVVAGGLLLIAIILAAAAPKLGGRDAALMAKAEARIARRQLGEEAREALSRDALGGSAKEMTLPAAIGAFVAGVIFGAIKGGRR
jgi:hypothetical protein